MMKKLPPIPFLFVRHGQTDWNKEERIMGQTDIPLNQVGRMQAHGLHETLQNRNISQIFYSPLSRAQETAQIVNEGLNVPMYPMNELKEWHWGDLEGKMKAEFNEKSLLDWAKDPHVIQAEPQEVFFVRIMNALNHVLANNEFSLVVSHGGVYWGLCQLLNCTYASLENCLPQMFKPIYLAEMASDYAWEVSPLKTFCGHQACA